MTVNIGAIAATTLQKYSKQIVNNATNRNALLYKAKKSGNLITNVPGGRELVEPLVYDGNGTFTRYTGAGKLNVNDGNAVDAATFTPVQASVNYTITGREQAMNRGEYAVHNLVKAKLIAAESEMHNKISQDLYSAGTLSNQIGGLQLLVADDPTTSTAVGGINQSTNTWWRNQVYDFSANSQTAEANFVQGLSALMRQCTFGTDRPDLVIMDDTYYGIFEDYLLDQRRFGAEESELAKAGFKAIRWNGADVVFESTASGITSRRAYVLNTKYVKFQMYEGRAMEPMITEGLRPIDQDAIVYPIAFMGNLTTGGRKFHGVLKD
jgi:hypothetical protein